MKKQEPRLISPLTIIWFGIYKGLEAKDVALIDRKYIIELGLDRDNYRIHPKVLDPSLPGDNHSSLKPNTNFLNEKE